MIKGKNFIGFQECAEGEDHFNTYNPIEDQDNPEIFTEASTKEIDQAVDLAADAFVTFSALSGKERGAFLMGIADEIEKAADELVECYCRESGLPEGRARGEQGRTINQLRSFAAYIDDESWRRPIIEVNNGQEKSASKPDLRNVLMALGPVAIFGASNFPFAFSTAGGDTASALAAGCPVVYKSHPMHSGTSELVASAILRAAKATNMPEGVFSHLHSQGTTVGQRLVAHPGIKAVGFTGSLGGGRALYELAAGRKEPIPVFAEMGSVNPVILLPGAIEEKADHWATQYAASITLGGGQFCTNPGLLFVLDNPAVETFTRILAEKLEATEPGTMLHPNIYENYFEAARKQKKLPGTEIITDKDEGDKPYGASPVLLGVTGSDFIKTPGLQHEVFGPFSILIKCKDEAELFEAIKSLGGQLTGCVIGESGEFATYKKLVKVLEGKVGRILFNGVPTGVEVSEAMHHGGPYPATTDSRFTSVGMQAIFRWVRPVCYQDCPDSLLPEILKNHNPSGIRRKVNGNFSTGSL